MKNFFKPTKVTWWVFGGLIGISYVPAILWFLGVLIGDLRILAYWFILSVQPFLYFFNIIGIVEVFPVTIVSMPANSQGWIIVIVAQLGIFYFIALVISKIWHKLKH